MKKGWEPVESAPKDGRTILAASERIEPASVFWSGEEGCWLWSCSWHGGLIIRFESEFTHWRKLPAFRS